MGASIIVEDSKPFPVDVSNISTVLNDSVNKTQPSFYASGWPAEEQPPSVAQEDTPPVQSESVDESTNRYFDNPFNNQETTPALAVVECP